MPSVLRSLYICYLPITEPLVQTQVVAYLAGLAKHGHHIHLLTFETTRMTAAQKREWRKRLKVQGITWHFLRYHKRPSLPATIYDVMAGVLAGRRIMRRHRLNVVHARAHVPAAMGLMLKKQTGCKLIFDIRGLLAEEREDQGSWQRDGSPFRITKALEKRCIDNSDGIVVLTERIRKQLFESDFDTPLRVIPCCADLNRIERQSEKRDAMRAQLGLEDKTVLVYVGKFGGWYREGDMAEFFALARQEWRQRDRKLHFLILTQSDFEIMRNQMVRLGVPESEYSLSQCAPDEIGAYLAAADIAISFISASPSKAASSPTKIGEYWAAGLPVISNPGVGDVDAIIVENKVGILVEEFTSEAYRQAIEEITTMMQDETVRERCRQVAQNNFSLDNIGIPFYCSLYEELAEKINEVKS